MSKSIMDDLYFGRINLCERDYHDTPERAVLVKKIQSERQYLESNLSPADYEHVIKFENLIAEDYAYEDVDCFSAGLQIGIMLLIEVFTTDLSSKMGRCEHSPLSSKL